MVEFYQLLYYSYCYYYYLFISAIGHLAQHFNYQLTHTTLKNVELQKRSKIFLTLCASVGN